MPAIPKEAIEHAKIIDKLTSFEASVTIGRQQLADGAPLAPDAGVKAVNTLLGQGGLVITADGKIDLPPQQQG